MLVTTSSDEPEAFPDCVLDCKTIAVMDGVKKGAPASGVFTRTVYEGGAALSMRKCAERAAQGAWRSSQGSPLLRCSSPPALRTRRYVPSRSPGSRA